MRVRLILGWILVLSLVAAIGYAQTPTQAPTLSLVDALAIARRSNPDYLAVLNDRSPASRGLLSATSTLFTPRVSLEGGYTWLDAGRRYVQGTNFSYSGPSSSQTGGSLQLSYALSGATFANRGLAAADLRATDQDITGAQTTLETVVRTQYLNVLEAQAQASVARRSLERANEQLNLAQARYAVGQGTLIDVRRAEVGKGTAEVTLLRADQNAENQVLLLYNRMGVPAPTVPAVTLTDSFPVVAPAWRLDSLLGYAQEQNPSLRSLRAREASARWNSRAVRSEYLPSLTFGAGTGRVGTHVNSFSIPRSPPLQDSVIPASTNWTTNPWYVNIGVSLPIYDGFSRYTRTAQARAREDDQRQLVRARELQVRSDVVSAFNGLQAAYQAVGLQESSKRASAEALELATQRYRVGSGSYLELLDARVAADQADTDYVSAVYAYHRAIAALEQAVGHTLR
jgi:outer membrane protein